MKNVLEHFQYRSIDELKTNVVEIATGRIEKQFEGRGNREAGVAYAHRLDAVMDAALAKPGVKQARINGATVEIKSSDDASWSPLWRLDDALAAIPDDIHIAKPAA